MAAVDGGPQSRLRNALPVMPPVYKAMLVVIFLIAFIATVAHLFQ